MIKLISSLVTACCACLAIFFEPWKKFSDLVLIKKESNFKFDGNQAINQAVEILSKTLPRDQTLQNDLNNSKILEKVKTELTVVYENFFNLINLNWYLGVTLTASLLISLFFSYKYFKLKKNFKKLTEISKVLLLSNNNLLNSLETRKNVHIQNQESTKNLIEKFKKLNEDFDSLDNNNTNEKLLHGICVNQKNNTKALLLLLSKKLTETIGQFRKESSDFINARGQVLHENMFKSRGFHSFKNKDSNVIYAGAALGVFSLLIELGLSDAFNQDFITQINQEWFPSSSYDWSLGIKDFDKPEKNLIFQTYSNDKYIERAHRINTEKLKTFDLVLK